MRLRLGFLVLGITTMMAFTGCSGNEQGAEELIEKAQDKMSDITSVQTEMDMFVNMKLDDEEISTITTAHLLTILNPLKMKIEVSSSMDNSDDQDTIMQMYVQEEGGEISSYANVGTGWFSSKLKGEDLGQFNIYDNIIRYLASIDNVVNKGQEKIGDISTFRIDGILKGEIMEEIIKESGILSSAESVGITEEEVQKILAELNGIPITLWVDEDGLVYQYEMDMSELMQLIMAKTMDLIGVAQPEEGNNIMIQEARISMVCSRYNEVEDFRIPEEALLAK